MKKILLLFIFIIACNSEPIRIEIEVGKTIKIEPTSLAEESLADDDLSFLWSPPNGPNNSNPTFKIENNKMLFTPNEEGEYNISLTIESLSKNIIYEETFLYHAVGNKLVVASGTNNSIVS